MSNITEIFAPDTKIYNFFEILWELFLLNIFYILTSLPIVTIGISTTALCQSVIALQRGEKGWKVYFSVWKTDWKQATVIWLLLLALLVSIFAYVNLFVLMPEEPSFWALLGIIALMICFTAVFCWVFPLLAQFNNTITNQLKNAAVLACAHPVKSLIMVACTLVPVALFVALPYWFFRLGFLWASVGLSGICYINLRVARPVLDMMIQKARKEAGLDDEPEDEDEEDE